MSLGVYKSKMNDGYHGDAVLIVYAPRGDDLLDGDIDLVPAAAVDSAKAARANNIRVKRELFGLDDPRTSHVRN